MPVLGGPEAVLALFLGSEDYLGPDLGDRRPI